MRGCLSVLLHVLVLPLCMGLFYVLFAVRQPFPTFVFGAEGAAVMAGVAGFFLWGGIYYLRQSWRLSSEASQLEAGGPWQDGQRLAVAGPVEAEGPLLAAPFTGRECLGYFYFSSRFSQSAHSSAVEIRDYEGFALTPSAIQSRWGRLKILAKADRTFLGKLRAEDVGGQSENRERATAYFQTTDYGELGGLKQAYHHETSDGPGSVRYDMKSAQDPEASYSLYEGVLQPGETVLLSGIYSAAQQAIGPDPNWNANPYAITPGGAANLAKDIRSNRTKAVVWAVLSGIAATIYFLVILPRYP